MNPRRTSRRAFACTLLIACTLALSLGAARPARADGAEGLRVVDCLLPAQLRRLGGRTTYLAARRPIKTTAEECEGQGGEYVLALVWPTEDNLEIWRPQARDGDPQAQTTLGEMLEKGVDGRPDYEMAALWYRRAADKNYARAQFNLASLHERGLGVDHDVELARELYARAAGVSIDAAPRRASGPGEANALHEARAALAAQTLDLTRAQEDLARAKRSVTGLQDRVRDLDAQLAGRQESAAQGSAALRRDLESARGLVAERDRQIARLRAALATAEADAARRLSDALAALEPAHRDPSGETAALRRALEQAQAEADALRDRAAEAARRERTARAALERLTGEREALSGRLASLSEAVSTQGQTQEDLRAELRRKDQVIAGKQDEVEALEGEVDRLQAELAQTLRSGQAALASALPASAASADDSLSRLREMARQVFGTYHALVIGNNDHRFHTDLRTAIRDAQDVAQVLKDQYGFHTRILKNATREEILTAINDYRKILTENDNFLIYYAGHGELDPVNQRGHWLPVDADPDNSANWLSDIQISDHLNIMTVRHAMVISDSCYSGILTRSGLKGLRPGMSDESRRRWLSEMAEKRVRVAFSSGGLQPVLDGGGGANSIFAQALLEALRSNDDILEGYELYRQTAELVNARASRHNFEQVPQYGPMRHTGHETGDFFFVRR